MIGSRQIKPRTALVGGNSSQHFAVGQQLGKPIFVDSFLTPFVVFSEGTFTKCYGYASVGTFTCEVYFDGVLKVTVSDTDHTTPVAFSETATPPVVVTFKITSASVGVRDIHVECT
jgi:hypothetical protein